MKKNIIKFFYTYILFLEKLTSLILFYLLKREKNLNELIKKNIVRHFSCMNYLDLYCNEYGKGIKDTKKCDEKRCDKYFNIIIKEATNLNYKEVLKNLMSLECNLDIASILSLTLFGCGILILLFQFQNVNFSFFNTVLFVSIFSLSMTFFFLFIFLKNYSEFIYDIYITAIYRKQEKKEQVIKKQKFKYIFGGLK